MSHYVATDEECAECFEDLAPNETHRSGLGRICDRCAAGRFPDVPRVNPYPPKFWCDVCGFSHALEPRPCER